MPLCPFLRRGPKRGGRGDLALPLRPDWLPNQMIRDAPAPALWSQWGLPPLDRAAGGAGQAAGICAKVMSGICTCTCAGWHTGKSLQQLLRHQHQTDRCRRRLRTPETWTWPGMRWAAAAVCQTPAGGDFIRTRGTTPASLRPLTDISHPRIMPSWPSWPSLRWSSNQYTAATAWQSPLVHGDGFI